MARETHTPEPHEYEAGGHTEPDTHEPGDDEWEWLLWIVVSLCGLGLSYCVIKIIEVLK